MKKIFAAKHWNKFTTKQHKVHLKLDNAQSNKAFRPGTQRAPTPAIELAQQLVWKTTALPEELMPALLVTKLDAKLNLWWTLPLSEKSIFFCKSRLGTFYLAEFYITFVKKTVIVETKKNCVAKTVGYKTFSCFQFYEKRGMAALSKHDHFAWPSFTHDQGQS